MKALDPAGRGTRLEVVGLVALVVVAALVALSIASYRHVFDDHVTVTLEARTAGQQLNVGGDVRMNGAIVGRVSAVRATAAGARIDLQIAHADATRIPTDVVARILPTTLFGQKYVELLSSSTTADGHLVDGTTIHEDTSAAATELTDVLDDLDPVITAIHPDRLAAALGGLAEGLDGHGKELAALMASSGDYLTALNARTPELEADLRLLQRVSGQYAADAPALLALLRNATVTARTVTRDSGIADFIAAVTGASTTGTTVLRANADRLAEVARLSRPTAQLLAEYSPELLCTIRGFLFDRDQSAKEIRHHSFQGHFTIGKQARGYTGKDAMRYGDLGTGPSCRGLPQAQIPYGPVDLNDGAGDTDLFSLMNGGGR